MRYIGIDPGMGGAVAHLDDRGFVGVFDMPLNQEKDFLDVHGLYELLHGPVTTICLEAVTPMGTDGRGSLGRFMTVYGAIRALAEFTTSELVLVRPYDWKRALGLVTPTKRGEGIQRTSAEKASYKRAAKETSMGMARELYPEASPYLRRKKDHDRAEAILLAHYLRVRKQ